MSNAGQVGARRLVNAVRMRRYWPAIAAILASLGCQPKIGDACNLSTDCSIQGDRICDTSMPSGYCTILQCRGNFCPSGSTCVAIDPKVPGCGYDDRRSPSRSTRSLCLAECQQDSDCRFGYRCQDIRQAPWHGQPLDDGLFFKVCIVGDATPDSGTDGAIISKDEPPVCRPGGPEIPPIDASEASSPMIDDAGTDADAADAADAGSEAGDAATD